MWGEMKKFVLAAAITISMTGYVQAEHYLCSADVSVIAEKYDDKWRPRLMSPEISKYIISKVKGSEASYSVRLVSNDEPAWVCESKQNAIFSKKGEIMCGLGDFGFWANLDTLRFTQFGTEDYYLYNGVGAGPEIAAGKCTQLVE